jgi:hypothetical protein
MTEVAGMGVDRPQLPMLGDPEDSQRRIDQQMHAHLAAVEILEPYLQFAAGDDRFVAFDGMVPMADGLSVLRQSISDVISVTPPSAVPDITRIVLYQGRRWLSAYLDHWTQGSLLPPIHLGRWRAAAKPCVIALCPPTREDGFDRLEIIYNYLDVLTRPRESVRDHLDDALPGHDQAHQAAAVENPIAYLHATAGAVAGLWSDRSVVPDRRLAWALVRDSLHNGRQHFGHRPR